MRDLDDGVQDENYNGGAARAHHAHHADMEMRSLARARAGPGAQNGDAGGDPSAVFWWVRK
jgi:hypothetical protein